MSAIARSQALDPSQVYAWRRKALASGAVSPLTEGQVKPVRFTRFEAVGSEMVEIVVGDVVLRVGGDVDPDRLVKIMRAVRKAVLPHFVWCRGSIRALRSSGPARPYIARLRVLRRLIWPSACPLLQGSTMALLTASMSLRRTRANRIIGMSSQSIASSIHASSGADLFPLRMLLKRIARRRISAKVSAPCFRASTFLACRSVRRPRGLMQSAAATTGEIL